MPGEKKDTLNHSTEELIKLGKPVEFSRPAMYFRGWDAQYP